MNKRKFLSVLIFLSFFSIGVFAETLTVYTNVAGGYVYVDGRYAGVAPVSVTVNPGSHSVRVEKSGYYDGSGSAYVQRGYNLNYTVNLERKPTTGTIIVKANVSAASVYLDGSYKGATPLTIRDVSPGSHRLRVTKYNYQDVSDTVSVTAGGTNTVTCTFYGADLKVDSNIYGSSVYVDGSYKGTTPITLRDIEPGFKTIKVTKKHYSTYSQTLNLEANKIHTLTVSLEKISGYLNTTVSPSGASLYCDGDKISSYNEEIDEGVHTIKARAFGYYDKSDSVTIRRNETTNHSMILEKCPFRINSFAPSSPSFNPKNTKRLKNVRFNISVTAPESGTLVVTDSSGRTVASWNVSFKTWENYVEWDGLKDGKPLDEGIYTATLKAGGFTERTSVTIDHTIKNYSQRARSSGIFFDVANLKGPFYDGWDLGFSTFIGGKHFYGGLAVDMLFSDIEDDYQGLAGADGLAIWDLEFLLGFSFNWHKLRPYTHGGIGYYYGITDGIDGKSAKVDGLVLSWTTGIDIVFDHFMIGGFYKLRSLNGCGYTDSWGISFGWAFDDHD